MILYLIYAIVHSKITLYCHILEKYRCQKYQVKSDILRIHLLEGGHFVKGFVKYSYTLQLLFQNIFHILKVLHIHIQLH